MRYASRQFPFSFAGRGRRPPVPISKFPF